MSSDHPPHLCAIGGGRADQASGNMQANLLPALLSARGRLSGEARMPQAKARPASEGTCHAGVAGHVAQLALRQAWNLSDQRGHVQSDRLLHITWVGRLREGRLLSATVRIRGQTRPSCVRSEILGHLEMASCTARRGAPTRSRGLD